MPTKRRAKKSTSVATKPAEEAIVVATEEAIVSDLEDAQLQEYAEEIKTLFQSTLESTVRIGEILHIVKSGLPFRKWKDWVEENFGEKFCRDSSDNYINLFRTHRDATPEHKEAMALLPLSSLYKITRSTVEPELREGLLNLAAQEGPINRDETSAIISAFRKVKMIEAQLPENVQDILIDSPISEDIKELNAIKKLSKSKQVAVANLLASGVSDSRKAALKMLTSSPEEVKSEEPIEVVQVTDLMKVRDFNSLSDISSDSVNIALVEAPLKYSYLEDLSLLSQEIHRVLTPGGIAIVSVGHKACAYAGPKVEPLQVVHTLCIRRTPGRTRSILGANILSASILYLMLYKPPYRSPHRMVADVQTLAEETTTEEVTDTEALVGLDEVNTGIEACFKQILSSIIYPLDTFLHLTIGEHNFGIRDALEEISRELEVAEFFAVAER